MSNPDNRVEGSGERIVSVNDYGPARRSWLLRLTALAIIVAIAVTATVHTIQRHLGQQRADANASAELEKAARKPDLPGQRRSFAEPAPAATPAFSLPDVAVGLQCSDGSTSEPMLGRDGMPILAPIGLPVRVCRNGQILMPPLPLPEVTAARVGANGAVAPLYPPGATVAAAHSDAETLPPTVNPYAGELILPGVGTPAEISSTPSPTARAVQAETLRSDAAADPHGPVSAMLRSMPSTAAHASMLGDRHLILPEGRTIDCNLSLRIISDISGKAVCVLSSYVYGDSGAVVLAEPGSVVSGDYLALSAAGQRRLFITWTRLKTSKGVVIDIDSPASDALGTSGLEGYLDNRWADRIGAAVLLSTVQDAIAYQTARASSDGNGNGTSGIAVFQQTTRSGKELAERILDSTINIKPTLYKHQGDRASITVARDLDFGSVYELRTQ